MQISILTAFDAARIYMTEDGDILTVQLLIADYTTTDVMPASDAFSSDLVIEIQNGLIESLQVDAFLYYVVGCLHNE